MDGHPPSWRRVIRVPGESFAHRVPGSGWNLSPIRLNQGGETRHSPQPVQTMRPSLRPSHLVLSMAAFLPDLVRIAREVLEALRPLVRWVHLTGVGGGVEGVVEVVGWAPGV